MKKHVLHPAKFKLDGGAMFGIIPKPLWEKKIPADEHNRILMSLRVVLIQTKNKNILIDTGIGEYHPEKFKSQFDIQDKNSGLTHVLENDFNLSPEDITDIILTHLHFDHVGGLGKGGENPVIFKNACLHIHKNHFEYSKSPTLRDKGSFQDHYFLPLIEDYYLKNNLVKFCEGEEGTLIKDDEEEIKFKTSFGHTPYMIHPIFDDYIYMADLVPMSHHVNVPWVMGYDIEPGTTTIYKQKFYDFIQEKNLKMIFEHDDNIIGGNLIQDEKNRYQLSKPIKSDLTSSQLLG